MTFIDVESQRTATIIRKTAGTQDAITGEFVTADATIDTAFICDIQPSLRERDRVRFDESGREIHADFLCLTQTKISGGMPILDLLIDAGDSEEYEIRGLKDWRSHWEILLKQIART